MFYGSRLVIAGVAIGAVMAYSQAAQAATYNFLAVANASGGVGQFQTTAGAAIPGGEHDWTHIVGGIGTGLYDTSLTTAASALGTISVVGSATKTDATGTTTASNAYFDQGAGLGVCAVTTGTGNSPCQPANDDNVGAIGGSAAVAGSTFESLFLTFSEAVSLTNLVFYGEGHIPFTGDLLINGALFTGSVLNAVALAILPAGTIFEFEYIPTGIALDTSNEFYLVSAAAEACNSTFRPCKPGQNVVPLPAALPLFLSGLGGMGFLGWRRRRKAAA